MRALETSPPSFAIAEAERLVRDAYGLAVTAAPLPGERDSNFRIHCADGRSFVLKVADQGREPAAAECHVRALRHVEATDPGLPVPRVVPTLGGDDLVALTRGGDTLAACLLSFLAGRPLAEVSLDAGLAGQVGRLLGRLDRALQGFFHPVLGRTLAWDCRQLPALAAWVGGVDGVSLPAELRRAVAIYEAAAPALAGLRAQAVHADAHAHNLLVDPATATLCGLVDFGDMIHAPLILEPGVALAELAMQGGTQAESLAQLVHGYALQRPFEAGEVELLYVLAVARHATTLLVHAWRVRHDPAGAQALAPLIAPATESLAELLDDRERFTRRWLDAAGAVNASPVPGTGAGSAPVDLERRRRLLGAHAELFYREPLHLVRGRGVWLYDRAGRAYLDVYNNVPHVGHCHPAVVEAIARQSATLATHTRYLHGLILDYAERLVGRLGALNACIFVNSGSEANDVAWRMAKFATGHTGGVVMAHAYHGITDAVAALTPAGGTHEPHVVSVAAPPVEARAERPSSPAALAAAAAAGAGAVAELAARGHRPAAFYLDSGLTSSGIHDPPPDWLEALVAPLRAAGALLVGDEVQYGLGRSGSHFWGFERRGFAPDIVTLGKPVGNGFPLGVVIARRELVEAFQARFGLFSTFGGNAVAAAAGLAVLDVIEREGLQGRALDTGAYARALLDEVAARHPMLGRVRGAGLLLGLPVRGDTLDDAKRRARRLVDRLAAEHGVLTGLEGPDACVLKLRPPLVFERQHADRLAAEIDAAALAD